MAYQSNSPKHTQRLPWEDRGWIKFSPSCYTYYWEFLCTLFKEASHWNLIWRAQARIQQSLKGVVNSIWVSLHSPIQNRLCVSKNKWGYHTRGLLSELSCWKQLPLLNTERRAEKGGTAGLDECREEVKEEEGNGQEGTRQVRAIWKATVTVHIIQCSLLHQFKRRKQYPCKSESAQFSSPSSLNLSPPSRSPFRLCLSFHLVRWRTEVLLPPLIKKSELSPTDKRTWTGANNALLFCPG